jgi:hypothetical protein
MKVLTDNAHHCMLHILNVPRAPMMLSKGVHYKEALEGDPTQTKKEICVPIP